ncbi:hypothetical protein ABE530_05075 [Brucella sp. TWI559]
MVEELVSWTQAGWASFVVATQTAAAWPKSPATFLLPISGLIAFAWAWKDRKNRARAESTYAEWKICEKPDDNGWLATQISITNRWDERLYAHNIRISGVKVARLSHIAPSSVTEEDETLTVKWIFLAAQQTPPSGCSGETLLYIKWPGLAQSGRAPSGTGPDNLESISSTIAKLWLTIDLTTSRNRSIRCIDKHKITSIIEQATIARDAKTRR